jgi:hypothetical protein
MRDDFPWGTLMMVAAGIVVIVFIFASGAGGGGTTTHTNSHNDNTTDVSVASDNKVLSDNGLYIGSEVTNCTGAGSCTTVVVSGERDVIIGSDGQPLCQDESTGIYSACPAGP